MTPALMTWAERALSWVAPRRARLRQHWRLMEGSQRYRETFLAAMSARGYRNAQSGDSKTPWTGANRSADAESLTDIPKLRSRQRELERDDPIASGLANTFANNVVGTGLRSQARTASPDKNQRIEAVWNERRDRLAPAEGLDEAGLQRMLFSSRWNDGGVLAKRTKRSIDDPLWFEVVEVDRIASGLNEKPQDNEGEIRAGVETDRDGVPVAYWVATHHPGDGFRPRTRNVHQRVPVSSAYHYRAAGRPGQTHGVPSMHAVLQDLRDLDLLLIAALKRTQIAACLAAFIQSEKNIGDVMDVTAEEYGYRLDQAIEPGMLFKLFPGETVETLTPNFPTPELEPFVIMLARRIGAALGVSWQIVLKDFSKANYSSARTDLLEAWATYGILQAELVPVLTWMRSQVLLDAMLRGDPRLQDCTAADFAAVEWIPPARQWVDPEKEAKATAIRLELKLTTLKREFASQGLDWQEEIRQGLDEEAFVAREREERGLGPAPVTATGSAAASSSSGYEAPRLVA